MDDFEKLLMSLGIMAEVAVYVIARTVEGMTNSYVRVRRALRPVANQTVSSAAPVPERNIDSDSTTDKWLCQGLDRFGFDVVQHMWPNVPSAVGNLMDIYGMKLILSEEATGEHCAYLADVFQRVQKPVRKDRRRLVLYVADERRRAFHTVDGNQLNPQHGRILLCVHGNAREGQRVFRTIIAAENKWTERAIRLSARS